MTPPEFIHLQRELLQTACPFQFKDRKLVRELIEASFIETKVMTEVANLDIAYCQTVAEIEEESE